MRNEKGHACKKRTCQDLPQIVILFIFVLSWIPNSKVGLHVIYPPHTPTPLFFGPAPHSKSAQYFIFNTIYAYFREFSSMCICVASTLGAWWTRPAAVDLVTQVVGRGSDAPSSSVGKHLGKANDWSFMYVFVRNSWRQYVIRVCDTWSKSKIDFWRTFPSAYMSGGKYSRQIERRFKKILTKVTHLGKIKNYIPREKL